LFGGGPMMQPPFQVSKASSPAAHLIVPVAASNAMIEFR
jgi:hypothetical protein